MYTLPSLLAHPCNWTDISKVCMLYTSIHEFDGLVGKVELLRSDYDMLEHVEREAQLKTCVSIFKEYLGALGNVLGGPLGGDMEFADEEKKLRTMVDKAGEKWGVEVDE
jgi:hypothetical protein